MSDGIDGAIDALVGPLRGESATHPRLTGLAQASPSRVARALIERASPWPSEAASALAKVADAVLRRASCRALLRVDSDLRGLSAGVVGGLHGVSVGWAGLLSMQRDGYTREAATHCLASHSDPLALRLLMLRCNDVVPQVSTAATQAGACDG